MFDVHASTPAKDGACQLSKTHVICPYCGSEDSMVLECTAYWDAATGDWVVSQGNDYPLWCNGGDEGDCSWEGKFHELKWEGGDGKTV